jgi:hypothetical protein
MDKDLKEYNELWWESSWGVLITDLEGNVTDIAGDEYIRGEHNYLYDIKKVDVKEYKGYLKSKGIEWRFNHEDILVVGFWYKSGEYNKPDNEWRNGVMSGETI